MKRATSLRESAAHIRWRLLAVTVVLMLSAGVAYDIGSTPPMYSESVAVLLGTTNTLVRSDSYASFGRSLIATEMMLVQAMLSPPAESQVRAAEGTAQFEFVPFNLYNMQYPDYAEPAVTLTTKSPSAADVRRTFRVILRLFEQRLAAIQEDAGVSPRNRIQAYLVGDTGPVTRPGSRARVFAGLALLTVVAVFMVSAFLGRRQGWADRHRPGSPRQRAAARATAMSDL